MSSAVDVEGLFRKFTVAEVKDIEKKIKADIERKKEDLRQMVGRRYRDIIEAADCINQMQTSSQKILDSMRRIERSVENLHGVQQQLIVAGQRAKVHMRPAIQSSESLAKYLADLIELAYEAAMYDQCLESAWYFMTADYLYRTWKLNHSQQADETTKAFLEAKFRAFGRLREKILKVATKCILNWSNSIETVLDAVCAVAFLERANLESTLERFLSCRKKAFNSVFTNTDTSSREQICSALSILQNTILQAYQLFSPSDGTSQTLERMRFLVTTRWQPPLLQDYAKRQNRLLSIALPEGIDHSKVFFMQSATDAQMNRVCEMTKAWFDESLHVCIDRLNQLVQYFESIESLTVVKESVVASLEQTSESFEWTNACQKLLGEQLSLWKQLCSGPLESRVKELVKRDVNVAFDTLTSIPIAEDKRSSSCEWWRELRTDTIVSGSYSTLQLKARGLTKDVHGPVSNLNSKIGQIDTFVASFLANRSGDKHRVFSFDDGSFHETLADACISSVERFLKVMDQKANDWRSSVQSNSKENEGIVGSLVTSAKLIQCLCDSAVSVRQCIVRRYGLANMMAKSKDIDGQQDKWSQLRLSLIKFAAELYKIWIQHLINTIRPRFEEQLFKSASDVKYWIEHAQEWESVQIEEEAEDGQKVFSTIYVPSACSAFVSQLLHAIARSIVHIGAQSVQSDVLLTLTKSLRSMILDTFDHLLRENSTMHQKRAVQFLFDFNVSIQMWQQSSSDKTDSVRVQSIVDRLGNFVDPFDLDVLKPHLKRNVSKVLQKWHALYRIAYTPEALRTSNVPSKSMASSSASAETPQLIPLGQGQNNRFYLLPVIAAESEKPSLMPSSSIAASKLLQQQQQQHHHQQQREASEGRHQAARAQTLASTFYDKFSWFSGN